jgi:hypothetical protein
MTRISTTRAGLLAALLLPGVATAAGLNDTGITRCANFQDNNLDCPQDSFPLQDAETGRDAQAGLSKAGGGSAGFDFTKVCNSGELAGHGSCPPAPLLGSDLTDWGCTRDNVTGLIWEIKTADGGLRDKDWTYTWFSSDSSTNGGISGERGHYDSCGGFLNNHQCNTEAYVAEVNALEPALCGYTDWRMPTLEELRGLVNYTGGTAIDYSYFPNTNYSGAYWSASTYAPHPEAAWYLTFYNGGDGAISKGYYLWHLVVRLVRGGE